MEEVEIDLGRQRPKPLTLELLKKADLVVNMGCGVEGVCLATFVETKDWELEDSKGKPLERVREIKDEIKAKVTGLWDRLQIA